MTPPRVRPPFVADERTQLIGWLDLQRALVHWKCEGLGERDAYRSVLPSSPLMSMAAVVHHLRWTEHTWFEVLFLGGPGEGNPQFDGPRDADMMPGDRPMADLLADYAAQCARSNEIVAAHPLDTPGRSPELGSGTATLRWMLLHMLEETARHVGHADTMRELLDGTRGYY